ncbi:SIMPL domain-containing protein [Parablautia intestinalis]|uniref:SIMPL domain-containing protein n=1 Tax=Parablautia intestinalis TaxID=2320100 RepID=UPI00259CA119|nr:SIMPL domain-containing protein [Parablautia intestinalis]
MKKIYAQLALGIIVLGLTGCGKAVTNDTPMQEKILSDTDNNPSAPSDGAPAATGSLTSQYHPNSITVNSSENVTVIPDIAEVVYAVRTQASDAAACQQQNAESVGQVIELLKSLSIEETSIQTSDYYMNPVYDYSNNKARVVGYESITTLTVSDLPIDGLDAVLSQSVSSGINTIQSITYQASKYDESYQAALSAAVETARQKAQVLAGAAGCSVGSIIRIEETSGYADTRYNDSALANKYRSGAVKEELSMADTAGIMPGEIQVEASIVVEYQLY